MKRFLSMVVPAVALVLVAGVAFAWMGGGSMAGGMGGGGMTGTMGPGMMAGGGMTGTMGPGMMGGGMMGGPAGQTGCPGMATASTVGTQVTEDKAKELAQEYADRYLKGFAVEKVLPFTGGHGTMFSVELKGPKDEVRVLHINPFGNVMPVGGPWRRPA